MIEAKSSWGSAGDGLCHGVVSHDLLMPAWSQANNIVGVTVLWAVVARPLSLIFWAGLDRDSLPGARNAYFGDVCDVDRERMPCGGAYRMRPRMATPVYDIA